MLFKNIEKPIVYIEIPQNCTEVYFENIELVFKCQDFQTFFINLETDLSLIYLCRLKCIILSYPNKAFYISSLYDLGLTCNNVLYFQSISPMEILDIKVNQYQVIFLQFDLSLDYKQFDWDALALNIATHSKIAFFVDIIDSSEIFEVRKCTSILEKLSELNVTIFLSSLFKEVELVANHPCNAYLCDGMHCHGNKSPFPRYITFTDYGAYPYFCINDKLGFLKDISRRRIISMAEEMAVYKNSIEYQRFILCNKKIYSEYILPRATQILSWNIMLQSALLQL